MKSAQRVNSLEVRMQAISRCSYAGHEIENEIDEVDGSVGFLFLVNIYKTR